MEILVLSWAVMAVIGYFIGNVKGNGAAGLVLGLLLGPVGWLITLCFSDSRLKCRMCHGSLDDAASCGAITAGVTTPSPDPRDSLDSPHSACGSFQGSRTHSRHGKSISVKL